MICTNKCHNCPNIIYISNPTIAKDTLELQLPNENIQNNQMLCFVITGKLPLSETPLPVKIIVNNTQFSFVSKSGNYVYSDQLISRRLYVGKFKTDSLILLNSRCNLCYTSAIINNINVPVPTPTLSVTKAGDKNDK